MNELQIIRQDSIQRDIARGRRGIAATIICMAGGFGVWSAIYFVLIPWWTGTK